MWLQTKQYVGIPLTMQMVLNSSPYKGTPNSHKFNRDLFFFFFGTYYRFFQSINNFVHLFQELPESQRADAVSSMVYEANARIRDPVYGCAGAICHLQKQVSELQTQLAKARAEVVNMQTQQANLLALVCMEMAHSEESQELTPQPFGDNYFPNNQYNSSSSFSSHSFNGSFLDDNSYGLGSSWEPALWT